ncbi:MAG TPA: hypothetical protein DCL38_05565, partial [Lachnospiraceae bacterium]|nr:hypothetical protein [Lachnospiraceae bacterium]
MNIFRHKEYIKEYELELLKQTAPYDYYLIASGGDTGSGKADGRGKKGRKAVLNVDEGSLNEELTDRFSDYRVYELSEWYIFIKEPAVPDWTVISEGLGSEEPLVYFDHDYITRGKRHTPYFKPEWSPDTFLSCDYIDDVFAVRAELFESEAYGSKLKKAANIHELIWQIAGKGADIGHVGRIAAHIETDSLFDEEVYEEYVRERNGITVQKALKALRGDACPVKGDSYFVSVIIPSKDHSEILENCLRSIIKSSFNKLNIEVLIVDNGSIESEKNKITDIINNVCNEFDDKHPEREGAFAIKYIYEPMEFDFSTMCTLGAREARYGLLLFLNDDIEVRDEDAIEKMCSCAMREDIGAVGVKLLYPETTLIQHDGITDLDCGPSHKLAGHDDRSVYYFGVNRFNRNVLAVTGACLMIGKEKYFNIGGFNVKMKVSYNDVELCLKCLKKGLRNLLLNDTVMYHHESLLRGRDDISEEKRRRLTVERELLYRTNEWLKRDG